MCNIPAIVVIVDIFVALLAVFIVVKYANHRTDMPKLKEITGFSVAFDTVIILLSAEAVMYNLHSTKIVVFFTVCFIVYIVSAIRNYSKYMKN